VGWVFSFSCEGVSALKHHRRGGEDVHVCGLIFAKSVYKGELVVD
jgi:hypothetical protein